MGNELKPRRIVMMKKLLLAGVVLTLVSGVVVASCINKNHVKTSHQMVDGKQVSTNVYACHIRGDDGGSFDMNHACKRCGCPQSSHDNQS
jgi:hypothetical protein